MNPLKIEQSSFFGIFIPGAFLFINVLYVNNIVAIDPGSKILSFDSGLTFENGFISFVMAIVLGFILRMLPYEYSDWFRKSKFPYFNHYFSLKWSKFPLEFRVFYFKYFKENYPEIIDNNKNIVLANIDDDKAKYIINNMKVRIFKENSELRDEVLFHEGASRLAVGTLYALVLSSVLIIASVLYNLTSFGDNLSNLIVLAGYFIMISIIYWRLPTLRGKEVRTVLEAYASISELKGSFHDKLQPPAGTSGSKEASTRNRGKKQYAIKN